MAKVVLTGGNGLVGKHLCKQLQSKGYEVAILSRTRGNMPGVKTYVWDLSKSEIDKEAIETADYIIHLAGANIGEKRWSRKRKQEILDSRIKSGELLFDTIKKQNKKPHAFISASAIGYYGARTSSEIVDETAPPSNDFLGKTCRRWEEIADKFADIGVRSVKLRTAIVLSKKGGALSKIMIPIKMGIGSAIGSGKQYFPWIHIDDLCGIYIKAMEDNQLNGAYNAVAPEHLTNKAFTQKVAQHFNKAFWFPNIPAIAFKLIFGEMAIMLLNGSRISSKKIQDAGYVFKFPNLKDALQQFIK